MNKLVSFTSASVISIGIACVSSNTFAQQSWSYTYHANGQIEAADGPRSDVNDVTTVAFDNDGNVSSVTNALGHVQQYTSYDTSGRVLQMIDANGIVSDFTYTSRGWLSTATLRAPSGNSSNDKLLQYGYDAVGQLTSMTLANASVIMYEYDGARRLTAIEDAQGNRIEYTLDAAGNHTAEVIKNSAGVQTKSMAQNFDELSRLREVIGADNQLQQFNYDVNNNLTSDINGRDFTTSQDYDALNRPTTTHNTENNPLSFTYDGRDNLTSVTDPRGLITTYSYDAFDNVTELNSPDTGITAYLYDEANNLITQTDARGVSVNYQYDALNRLLSETYPTSPSLNKTYTYDDTNNGNSGVGRLTQIQDELGTTNYVYDFSGNLLSNEQSIDGNSYTIAYQYNTNSAVTQLTYPSNRSVNYTRNNLEQITQITTSDSSGNTSSTLANGISYLPFGPLDNLSFGNGLSLSRSYDQDYRLAQHSVGALTALSYQYDDNNNITDINNGTNPVQDQSFAYDAMDRLELENGEYGAQTYLYDEVGNRLEKATATETQTLTYANDSNRLIVVDGNTVSQDQSGNTTHTAKNNDAIEYRYGDNERYQDVYINNQLRASYQFNALGQRTKKTDYNSNGQIDHFKIYHYDPAGQLISTTLKSATSVTTHYIHYVWLDNLPLAQITDSVDTNGNTTATEILYLHADHLNTPRIATNQSQTEVWNWQSDAFGVGDADVDPDGDGNDASVALRFPGQFYDEETGLHYNYFRDYDASLGRYVESDPIGLMGGVNTYGYVGGNPLGFVDPYGLWSVTISAFDGIGVNISFGYDANIGRPFLLGGLGFGMGGGVFFNPNGGFPKPDNTELFCKSDNVYFAGANGWASIGIGPFRLGGYGYSGGVMDDSMDIRKAEYAEELGFFGGLTPKSGLSLGGGFAGTFSGGVAFSPLAGENSNCECE